MNTRKIIQLSLETMMKFEDAKVEAETEAYTV